ncbi:hypothetical protein ES754_09015 [Psychrobacter frigidicola]|uniref:Uncharacterized protein n=1 Tax=Psychrobacter frigidicola TaxID=45611 RepID=A0A5C7A934_9GAMM|nr:hypothetical protein ES754_09015 [Psychrobacter frigidicola]
MNSQIPDKSHKRTIVTYVDCICSLCLII